MNLLKAVKRIMSQLQENANYIKHFFIFFNLFFRQASAV